MSTAVSTADIRFLRLILVALILCTLVSGGVCVRLASIGMDADPIRIVARL